MCLVQIASTSKNWWIQFPYPLRLITKIRFYAAFGAGGTLFNITIFVNIGLSATDTWVAISAIIGTVTSSLQVIISIKEGKYNIH